MENPVNGGTKFPFYLYTIHSMKPIPFDGNGNGLIVTYHRSREGPNYFNIYYKQSSVLRQDPKDAWRILGPAKFTDSGKALKEWCLEMDEKYGTENKEAKVDTSFASEVLAEQDPSTNTKIVI